MIIVDDKALVLKTRTPHKVTETIKKSKDLGMNNGIHEVAVHWGFVEAQQLTKIGARDVPSPMLRDYKWTGKLTPFDHQRTTSSFLTLNPRSFCFSEAGCVDADTEYLSPTGWVRIADYAGGQVAQYNPDAGTAEFVDPVEYVKLPCAQMVRVKTKYGVDQLLSPEHRVLVHDGKLGGKYEVLPAQELLARHEAYHAKIAVKHVGGTRSGTPSIAFSSAAVPTVFTPVLGGELGLTDAHLRLQVAVMADGYFGAGTNHCVVRLKKQRKIKRLRALLSCADVAYVETESAAPTAVGFHIFKFSAPLRKKSYDEYFWGASLAQLTVIAEECMYWDGSTTHGMRFSTSDKASADFIQYAFCASGKTARVALRHRERRGRIEAEYVVQVRPQQRLFMASRHNNTVWEEPSTDGFKYCFMVPSTFLIFRRNGCVFASGNTGKTASVIWAADYLMNLGLIKRVLVVCPLSIMKAAWQADLFKFAMHRSCAVAHGDAKARRKIIESGCQFTIINFDGVAVVKDAIIHGDFDLVVIDEGTSYKNPQTNRWKVMREVTAKVEWLWLLTGTPAAQSPLDAYGLAKLVCPDRTPKYFGQFRDTVMYKVSQFIWKPKSTADKIVHNMLQPAIRFEKKDCLDLPDVVHVDREAPLTPQQQKYYKLLKKKMVMEAAGESITSVNAAVNVNKLLQISGGAVYSDTGEVVEFDVSNRLNVVLEVIEETSNKVLVFVPFTHTIELLKAFLDKHKVTSEIIAGSVTANKRTEIFSAFQTKPDPRVLIIQPQAAAHGVTLTAADTVVWYAPVPSVETYLQANARINRPGQKNNMTIVHVVGSEIEARLYTMLRSNVQNHNKIVDLYRKEVEQNS